MNYDTTNSAYCLEDRIFLTEMFDDNYQYKFEDALYAMCRLSDVNEYKDITNIARGLIKYYNSCSYNIRVSKYDMNKSINGVYNMIKTRCNNES